MTMKTRSVSPAPIWNPTLPPSTMTVEGALQPLSVRQTTTPLPYFAPTMNPARFRLGITPTHCALPSRSSGMPLSFVSRIFVEHLAGYSYPFLWSARIKASDTHKNPDDVLLVPALNPMANERTGYPTQKPLELLERLIRALTAAGGTVGDFFCGSGTTL